MSFQLSNEQMLIRKMMVGVAESEVESIAEEIDCTCSYPAKNVEQLFSLGIMGMNVPQGYGGCGADVLSGVIAVEELAKQCAATASIVAGHNMMCCEPILRFGTEEQKKKYLLMLTKQHKLGTCALTDMYGEEKKTVAQLDGNTYVLNGVKASVPSAAEAEVFVAFALLADEAAGEVPAVFVLEKRFAGLAVGEPQKRMGLRGAGAADVSFTNCRVPKENLLAKGKRAREVQQLVISGNCLGAAAQSLGLIEAALARTIEYTKGRVQFGKQIAQFQNTQFMLADMDIACEAGRLMLYHAAELKEQGGDYIKLAAEAKIFCGENAVKATVNAVQLFGGYGYMKDYPMERMMRDAEYADICAGTMDAQRDTVAACIGL